MTFFSSRGPGGDWLKPDITAPGLHILAGNTPTPEDPSRGPPGNLFQAIAGTSMSSPHAAGLGGAGRRVASQLDTRPDQVGAGDHRQDRRGDQVGPGPPRPTRSTSVAAGST